MEERSKTSFDQAGSYNEFQDLDARETGLLSYDDVPAGDADDFIETLFHDGKAEEMLADAFKKLDMVEHEKILFDVHGLPVDDTDPANIETLLQQVEDEICTIRNKHAYEHAKYLDESYVCYRSFRLRFLRCDKFDARLAAQRVVRHFEVKRWLFGSGQVLARDVRLSDLDTKAMHALESGFLQVLPSRDVAGRSIFSIAPMHRPKECTVEDCGKAMWYVMNTTMSDEETQRKGIVGIMSNFGPNARREPYSLMRSLHRIRSGIPKKIVGIHYCYDDASMMPFVTGIQLFLDKEMRDRVRPHFGDRDNIEFELQTYGIPTKDHPILSNGKLSLEWHRVWLNVRRAQEESKSVENGILCPRRFDVLFGRGRNTRMHTGNLRAAHLVEMHQEEYEKAGKFEKTKIAGRIVSMINESFGRFLRWEDEGWVEVDYDTAREKVSHFFRHLRSKTSTKGDDAFSSDSGTPSESVGFMKRVTPSPTLIHSSPDAPSKSPKLARPAEM